MNNYVELIFFFSIYYLEGTEENFNIIKKLIKKKKKKYLIYQEIFNLIKTCRKIESKSNSITIEIDAENNKKLLDDINKKYFIKKLVKEK